MNGIQEYAGWTRALGFSAALTLLMACGAAKSLLYTGVDRDAFQQPDRVLDALALAPGMTVADVGAGAATSPGSSPHAWVRKDMSTPWMWTRACCAYSANALPRAATRMFPWSSTRADVICKEMEQSGYRLDRQFDFLEHQNLQVFVPVEAMATPAR